MSDDITNKILSNFESVEDIKEYASSQYKTIITQSKKITELERRAESLETKLADAEKRAAVSSSLSIEQPEGQSDTETVCVIQIAMLKGLAMNKELTLEETKKLEVFAKTLQMIRGKPTSDSDKKRDVGTKLTTEQLLALASSLTEQ
jgi:uncharacterized coiled-coil DUF342 family protein